MPGAALARRLAPRPRPPSARRAWRALRLWLALLALAALPAQATPPDVIVAAEYAEPTTRYAHGVLGDAVEWGALVLTVDPCLDCPGSRTRKLIIRLPETRVFEDTAPRIIEGDDTPSLAMVVESDLSLGARLALYDERGLYAATPFIGRANRWLAPIGAADLDGDGWPEIVYIDRPHLAKNLRIWRLKDGRLAEIASAPGLTNHRIGEDFITSGLRDCGEGPEIITADAAWTRIMASRLENGRITSRSLGPFSGPDSLAAALACR
jgi:hypothetical protein